jgi:hypothetical protein
VHTLYGEPSFDLPGLFLEFCEKSGEMTCKGPTPTSVIP